MKKTLFILCLLAFLSGSVLGQTSDNQAKQKKDIP